MKNILLIIGTSREGRKTTRASNLIEERFKEEEGFEVTVFDPKENPIPPLSKRRNRTDDSHENVELLGQLIEDADCIIPVTPEYNHSIPGELKNMLDHFYPEYEGKPFSYVTTSGGGFGGVRMQSHLHDVTLAVNAHPGPSLPISNLGDTINEEGELVDESYESRIDSFIEKTEDFVEKLR
jgi:chromate reductase